MNSRYALSFPDTAPSQLRTTVKYIEGKFFGLYFKYTLKLEIITQLWIASTKRGLSLACEFKPANILISKYHWVNQKVKMF
jgi:hypothetical protein